MSQKMRTAQWYTARVIHKRTPKILLFDVDGVLFNTDEVYFAFLKETLKAEGISIDEQFFMEHHYDDCIDDLGLDSQTKSRIFASFCARYYSDEILRHVRMKDGVLPVLDSLSKAFHLATSSGESEAQIKHYLDHFGLAQYFSFVGHGGLVEGRKSNPAYFHTIARHFGVEPGECLHVGDAPYDQQALAAGVPVVIIPTRFTAQQSFDPRCIVLKNVAELPEFLKVQRP